MGRSSFSVRRAMGTCRPSSSGRNGAALVELAVVLPVFLMIVLGIIEFGRGMHVSQMVGNAAREACREAILDNSSNSAIETYVKDFLSDALGVSTGDVTIEFYVNDVLADVNTAVESDRIRVHVEVPFDAVSLTGGKYLAGRQLVGETTMRHE